MFYTQTGNIYQVKEWKIPYCSDLSDDTCNKLSDCLFYYYLRPKRKFFFVSSVGMYTYTWDARLSFSRRRKQETERWRFLIIAKESSHRVPSFSPLRGCAHTFKSLIAWKKRRRVALAFECTHTHTTGILFPSLFFFLFLVASSSLLLLYRPVTPLPTTMRRIGKSRRVRRKNLNSIKYCKPSGYEPMSILIPFFCHCCLIKSIKILPFFSILKKKKEIKL